VVVNSQSASPSGGPGDVSGAGVGAAPQLGGGSVGGASPRFPGGKVGRAFRLLLQALGALVLAAILLGATAWGGLEWWARRDGRAPGAPRSLHVELREGLSMRGVVRTLDRNGVARPAPLMTVLVVLHGAGRRLKGGEYAFAPGTPPIEVMRALVLGPEGLYVKVTLPEGWTAQRIADRLVECGVIVDRNRFLRLCANPELLKSVGVPAPSAEGFLFPDTYRFPRPTDGTEVIRRMAARFQKEVQALQLRPGVNSPSAYGLSCVESVILASILQRESGDSAETPLISSVFHNRLKRGMPLGSCATVRFVLNKWDAPLTTTDLKADSPYNTYIHRGLPPSPICNPGRAALEAAFRPAASDFLYFVYRGNRRHAFSQTLREHEQAREKYKNQFGLSDQVQTQE